MKDTDLIQLLEIPLSAKELFARVSKGEEISYQAIHKKLLILVVSGTLIKVDNKYLINPFWVKQQKEFFGVLEKSMNEKFCSTRRIFVKVMFEHSFICILYSINCFRK